MQSPIQHRIKVLITDDHQFYRSGVRNSLSGFEDLEVIGEAENGQDLLNKLKWLHPDVITLGIQMPVMDGLQALPILRKNYPDIKIVMLSMHNDPGVICKMLELGANSYLTKEAGAEEIHQTIIACMSRWLYINETVQKGITYYKSGVIATSHPALSFTEKEIRIMELLKKELPQVEIAAHFDLSPRTVHAIIEKLKNKIAVTSDAALLEYAEKNKLIN